MSRSPGARSNSGAKTHRHTVPAASAALGGADPRSPSGACPLCGGWNAHALMPARRTPILLNRVYPTRAAARAAPTGPICFVRCAACGFAWNVNFDPALIDYVDGYENNQGFSPHFAHHLSIRADDVAMSVPEHGRLLEIGCGQGDFLRLVANRLGDRLGQAEGFDPALREPSDGVKVKLHAQLLAGEEGGRLEGCADVVVSRHTIEHVGDPLAYLALARKAAREGGVLFVETPDIDWILTHRAWQDFFYEHCSLFSEPSLSFALSASGFRLEAMERVFGGQYLWARAVATGPRITAPTPPARFDDGAGAAGFVQSWRQRLEEAQASGGVAIWGAGAKGVMFAVLVDPEGEIIDEVVDMNPNKQGGFLPVTGLPVIKPQAVRAENIFVMNPNYLDEIAGMLRSFSRAPALVPVE